jgi:hypothetical protein
MMMRSGFIFYGLILVTIISCHSTPGSENADSTAIKAADTVKRVDEIRTNMSYLNDYNAIEQVFGNENWLVPGVKDSSYLYLSRLGSYSVSSYVYSIAKGDSANVKHSSLERKDNTINWEFDGKKLVVAGATSTRVVLAFPGTEVAQYEFIRLDANHLQLTYPDKTKKVLLKTLPFSTFLVRSRYDYTHGTKYAFDSVEFGKKRPA